MNISCSERGRENIDIFSESCDSYVFSIKILAIQPAVLGHVRPFQTILDCLWPFLTTLGHFRPFRTISSGYGPFQTISGHFEVEGTSRGHKLRVQHNCPPPLKN